MNNEQFLSKKKRPQRKPRSPDYTSPEYQQLSLFDVLPEEDWGDARPLDYERAENPRHSMVQRILKETKKMQKVEESEIERTCVWCGEVIDGPLDVHEEECSS